VLIGLEGERARPISIGFLGFHCAFNSVWNNVTHSLAHRFCMDVSVPGPSGHLLSIPNFLFFSVFQDLHRDPRYDRCVKIFTCEENIRPPWSECQYAMTGDYSDDPRHLRLPIYVRAMKHVRDQPCYPRLREPCPTLVKDPSEDWDKIASSKTKFCNFIVSNKMWRDPRAGGECGLALRIRFFQMLSRYKRIDSGGKVENNLGHQVADKLPFIQDYRFTLAFESASYPGYVSEKLVEPMFVHSIPIYWGCPRIAEDFNPESFVVATGRRLEDVVEEVAALDRNPTAYLAKLRQPWFRDNVQNKYCPSDYLADFLARVFAKERPRPS